MAAEVSRLQDWLRRRLAKDANLCLVLSPVAILAGLLVLFLTFWFSYVVILMVGKVFLALPALMFDAHWRLTHRTLLWCSWGFVILLVVSYWRSDRKPMDLSEWDENPSTLGQALARFGANAGRASMLLAYPEASSRIIVDLLNIGPRLLVGGFTLLRESGQSRSADTLAGARLLWTLLAQGHKTPYAELENAYSANELTAAFHALRPVQGVVFLEGGMTLTEELRLELLEL